MTRISVALVLMLAFFAAACTRVEPYIHAPEKTNRLDANFGKEKFERGSMTICYNKYRTTPAEIVALAVSECRRFGGTALFQGSNLTTCPLIAPYGAVYNCWKPPVPGSETETDEKNGDGANVKSSATPKVQ